MIVRKIYDKQDVVDKEKAKKMLAFSKDGKVHTFVNFELALIGVDNTRESIYEAIDNAYQIKITGEQAQAMRHGLVIIPSKECNQSDLLFVETKKRLDLK